MTSLTRELTDKIFDAASIQRWNDHIRPVELTELDKQAHKAITAYVIARIHNLEDGHAIDWRYLMDLLVLELFQAVALTDIKRPVIHYLWQREPDGLKTYIVEQYEEILAPDHPLMRRIKRHFQEDGRDRIEWHVNRAASAIATLWEFDLLAGVNSPTHPVEKTRAEILAIAEDYLEFSAVERMLSRRKPYGFVNLCGQLRFQKRWSNSPRVPQTAVLGHVLMVAVFMYLVLGDLRACDGRLYAGFFAALFHDLPEALTRDIVSPVKTANKNIDRLVKQVELRAIEESLLPLLPPAMRFEIEYFTRDEFQPRIVREGKVEAVPSEEINKQYNEDGFLAVDGDLLKVCDHLAAFLEARKSMESGINSPHLQRGAEALSQRYRGKSLYGFELTRWFSP